VCTKAYEAVLGGLLVGAGAAAAAALDVGLWPHEWPWALQLALGLVLGELGAYAQHRLCHASELFWRVHAMHHSPDRLYLLASGRNHPLNVLLAFLGQTAPLILLGAGAPILALHAVFTAIVGYLQHSNLDADPGPLRWVVATNTHHRWHHSRDMVESNTNFGNNLIVWDRLFGTCFEPADRAPRRSGVDGLAMPTSYLGQLASPFTYPTLLEGAAAAPETGGGSALFDPGAGHDVVLVAEADPALGAPVVVGGAQH
jgi:sterol desaturase/sphingolipid hydroxylase (fatty acid hydroxylase superfamily)